MPASIIFGDLLSRSKTAVTFSVSIPNTKPTSHCVPDNIVYRPTRIHRKGNVMLVTLRTRI